MMLLYCRVLYSPAATILKMDKPTHEANGYSYCHGLHTGMNRGRPAKPTNATNQCVCRVLRILYGSVFGDVCAMSFFIMYRTIRCGAQRDYRSVGICTKCTQSIICAAGSYTRQQEVTLAVPRITPQKTYSCRTIELSRHLPCQLGPLMINA